MADTERAMRVDLIDLLTSKGVEGDSVELLRNATPSKTPDVKDVFAPLAASVANAPPPPMEQAFNFEDAAAAVEEYLSDEDSQSGGSVGPMRHSLSRDDLLCLHDMAGASEYDYEQSEASNAMEFLLDKAALSAASMAEGIVDDGSLAAAEVVAEAMAERAREATEREQMGFHDTLLASRASSIHGAIADTSSNNALTCRPEPDNIIRIRSDSHLVCEVSEEAEGEVAQAETPLMRGEEDEEAEEGAEDQVVCDEGMYAAEIANPAGTACEVVVAEADYPAFVVGVSESLRIVRTRRRWAVAVAVADAMAAATENTVAAGGTVARLREEAETEAKEVEAQQATLLMTEEEEEEARQLAIASAPPPVLRKTTPPPGEQAHAAVEQERKAVGDRESAASTDPTVAAPTVAGAVAEAHDAGRTAEVVIPTARRVAKEVEAYEEPDVHNDAPVDAPVDAPEAEANAPQRTRKETSHMTSQSNWGILARKLGADVFCAGAAAAAVSPFVGAIDKVVESVSGSASIAQSMRSSFAEMAAGGVRGVIAAPQFRYLFAIYTGTYATANAIRTVYEAREADPSLALCVGTTAVNASLSLVKDKALAQIFGASASAAKGVPVTAYGWWLGRDVVTMGMVFTAPPKVSKLLQSNLGWSPNVADVTATLAIPVVIQPLTTGMHLLGIDFVNRPTNVSVAGRLGVVGKSYGESLFARIGRIFVPYSIGGLVNSKMRASLHKASSSWSALLSGARGVVVPSMAK